MIMGKSKDFLNFVIDLLDADASKVNDIEILEQFVSDLEKEVLPLSKISKYSSYYINKFY